MPNSSFTASNNLSYQKWKLLQENINLQFLQHIFPGNMLDISFLWLLWSELKMFYGEDNGIFNYMQARQFCKSELPDNLRQFIAFAFYVIIHQNASESNYSKRVIVVCCIAERIKHLSDVVVFITSNCYNDFDLLLHIIELSECKVPTQPLYPSINSSLGPIIPLQYSMAPQGR